MRVSSQCRNPLYVFSSPTSGPEAMSVMIMRGLQVSSDTVPKSMPNVPRGLWPAALVVVNKYIVTVSITAVVKHTQETQENTLPFSALFMFTAIQMTCVPNILMWHTWLPSCFSVRLSCFLMFPRVRNKRTNDLRKANPAERGTWYSSWVYTQHGYQNSLHLWPHV